MTEHPLVALSRRYLLTKNIAVSTEKSYKIAFKLYINYLKANNIEYAKTSDVIKYREMRRNLGDSTYYIYIHISALKGLYRYLRINQSHLGLPIAYAYDIMAPIKNERIKQRINKPILSLDQAKQLILQTKNNRRYFWHYRDHAIICLMLTAGLSCDDIFHALRENLKPVDGQLVLYLPKKTNQLSNDYVKISKGTEVALQDYLALRNDQNPYLFISHKKISRNGKLSRLFFMDMFPRVLKMCHLEGLGITPHCLRHTAAILNLQRGASLEETRQLLRHDDLQSTLIYQEHIERLKDDSESLIESFILKEEVNMKYYEYFNLFEIDE